MGILLESQTGFGFSSLTAQKFSWLSLLPLCSWDVIIILFKILNFFVIFILICTFDMRLCNHVTVVTRTMYQNINGRLIDVHDAEHLRAVLSQTFSLRFRHFSHLISMALSPLVSRGAVQQVSFSHSKYLLFLGWLTKIFPVLDSKRMYLNVMDTI